jgi:hypothetical protein
MGKPTEEQFEDALREAARMREHGEDPHFVAKSLLNLNYRFRHLERVLQAARQYLHSGQASHEHGQLVHAIDQALEAESRSAGDEPEDFGLGEVPDRE